VTLVSIELTLRDHADHGRWRKVGPCLYCTCGERLYQGSLPKSMEKQREVGAALAELQTAAADYFKARVEHDKPSV
jgi:hypothetical protein